MKQITFIIVCCLFSMAIKAQTAPSADSAPTYKVTIIKDSRLDELARKEAIFNEVSAKAPKAGRGYRLAVLSTNDRALAMKVRAQLLQRYPDQKIYMSFQPPYIKLKFGDYVEKADAENTRKDLIRSKLLTGNIYVVPDTIEIKADKNEEK